MGVSASCRLALCCTTPPGRNVPLSSAAAGHDGEAKPSPEAAPDEAAAEAAAAAVLAEEAAAQAAVTAGGAIADLAPLPGAREDVDRAEMQLFK